MPCAFRARDAGLCQRVNCHLRRGQLLSSHVIIRDGRTEQISMLLLFPNWTRIWLNNELHHGLEVVAKVSEVSRDRPA